MSEKIGVMVVHGIGDPVPGEALHSLTDALANRGSEVAQSTAASFDFGLVEEERLAGQHPRKAYLPIFFPMFLRRAIVQKEASAPTDTWIFAEVFWGSASQLPAGMLGVLQGVVRLFFRSNVIITLTAMGQDAAADALAWLRRAFFTIAQATSYLLTAPIFALNVLLLLALLFYRFGVPLLAANNGALALKLVLYGSGGLGLLVTIAVWGLSRWWPDTLVIHLRTSAWWLSGLILLWWLWSWGSAPTTVEAVIGLPAAALVLAFLLVALGLALLILARGVHWIVGERRRQVSASQGPPLTIALFTLLVQYGLWVVLIPTFWTLLLTNLGNDAQLMHIYERLVRTDGVQWFAVGIIGLFGLFTLVVWWGRTQQIKRAGQDQGPTAQSSYRLIVHPLLSVPMAVVTFAVVLFVLIVTIAPLLGQEPPGFVQWLLLWIQQHRVTPVVASLALLIIPLIGGPLRLALDLVNDIITYVDQQEHDDPSSAQATNGGEKRRPPAGAIRPRFRQVLDYLQRTEKITRLIVIAHSQGSVIALDELASANGQLDAYRGKITLITMGSPIYHLYQHYFPGAYPDWQNTERWQQLFQRLHGWHHYYRIDDFVGMELQPTPPNAIDLATLTDFHQEGLSDGGHTEYWQDDRFIARLQELLGA